MEKMAWALLDAPDNKGRAAWLFDRPIGQISVRPAEDLTSVLNSVRGALSEGTWVVSVLGYEFGHALLQRPLLTCNAHDDLGHFFLFDSPRFVSSEEMEGVIDDRIRLTRLENASEPDAGLYARHRAMSYPAYEQAIKKILRYIQSGDCYQINFTQHEDFSYFGHPLEIYKKLRRAQPVSHGGLVCWANRHLLSLSPELFVEREGDFLRVRPMKGTAARHKDPAQDNQQALFLQNSPKDRAENLMIVDLLRNDLGRVARTGGVSVESLFEVEAYPTVWQMTSSIRAELDASHPLDLKHLFEALYPCGSITGAPKIRAMEIIQELEKTPRGVYTGSMGWLAPQGDFHFNVAIRTLELVGENGKGNAWGHGRLGIGSGIVADSDPMDEWNECLLKSRFLDFAPPPFQLIETMLWRRDVMQEGHWTGLFLLKRHLERLQRSADQLGFRWNDDINQDIRRTLLDEARRLDESDLKTARVRLLYFPDGHFEITSAPLSVLPDRLVLCLAPVAVDRENPLLLHKTTCRSLYDKMLSELPSPEVFDFAFFNEDQELTEGARSNIFLWQNGVWRTPALKCGLLDGVMRREFMHERRAAGEGVEETSLSLEDLLQAERIILTNALRGSLEVSLYAPAAT